MRLAISNIAWDVAEDEAVAGLLGRHGVDAIDVAPMKYFPNPAGASDTDVLAVRRWWQDRGVAITGMQALLFGTQGLNLFGTSGSQRDMRRHLQAVCRVARVLGARHLVFGSPKNRDRSGLADGVAESRAVDFFRQLSAAAATEEVVICLEPNPVRYGANFMTTSEETARIVAAVAHPAIRMQLDIGALTINGEDPQEVLARWASLIGHVHASEPDLVPLGDGTADHRRAATALQQHLPGAVVSIEMVATRDEPHVVAIERALLVAAGTYRAPGRGSA